MSKAGVNRVQEKQLSNGCIGKRRYGSEEAAHQKGQTVYHCLFCDGWHRASIKKAAPQTTKNGLARLPGHKPKAKPACNHAQEIESLKTKNAALGQEIEKLKAALIRRKQETRVWQRRYERTIEGRLVNCYHAARKRWRKRSVTP